MIDRSFKLPDPAKSVLKTLTLPKETELRVRVDFDPNVYLKVRPAHQLDQGTAEIFGAEMTPYYWYRLPRVLSVAVYTWGSCTMKISVGAADQHAKEKEPHYYEYAWQPEEDNCNYCLANCFCLVDNLRAFALHALEPGPRVLVMGGASAGKSTVSRTLANYSAKVGWESVFLDLDPENNEISALGTVSAATFAEYMPVGAGQQFDMNEVSKLSFFFGYDQLSPQNLPVYLSSVKVMMELVEKRLQNDREKYVKERTLKKTGDWKEETPIKGAKSLFAAGCIINAPAFFAEQHPQMAKSFVSLINPTVVLVIDHDGLKSALRDTPNCQVIKIPKSGGVVHSSEMARRKLRELRLDNYFFDERSICSRDQLPVVQLPVYKLIMATTEGALGQTKQELQLVKVDPLITNISKQVLGVTTLSLKVFASLVEAARVEAVLRSPLQSLAYVFEVKEIQPQAGQEPQKEAFIIRPSHLQANYTEHLWLMGDLKNFHG